MKKYKEVVVNIKCKTKNYEEMEALAKKKNISIEEMEKKLNSTYIMKGSTYDKYI